MRTPSREISITASNLTQPIAPQVPANADGAVVEALKDDNQS
jgi:hypothetical protein